MPCLCVWNEHKPKVGVTSKTSSIAQLPWRKSLVGQAGLRVRYRRCSAFARFFSNRLSSFQCSIVQVLLSSTYTQADNSYEDAMSGLKAGDSFPSDVIFS